MKRPCCCICHVLESLVGVMCNHGFANTKSHEYDVLLAFDEPLCCQSSCMSLAIAMLLSETNGKYCFYFNNGFALEKVDYGDKPTFIERLQCIVTILKPLIMPCVFADRDFLLGSG